MTRSEIRDEGLIDSKLKVLDLFSGIGGFSLGLERTGLFETVAFCEWDEGCRHVLKKHWPHIPCFGDVEQLAYSTGLLHSKGFEVPCTSGIDVITGGFPCQDISMANRAAEGISGSRSGYWKQYARLVNEVKPKGVIIENVSALLRRGLDVVLEDLHKIGYDVEWHCITAKYFGACHERDRVFILAYRRGIGGEGFKPLQRIEKVGQGWESCKENLQQVYDNPFRRSCSFPQPLLRGVDVRTPRRVDRLKQVGNSVYWPIVERLGYHMYQNINGV